MTEVGSQKSEVRNPVKGKGIRYIYCVDDSQCIDLAIFNDWKAFNCEQCEIYKKSHSGPMDQVKKPEIKNNRRNYMSDKKNQLIDLNNALFDQMKRLTKEDLSEEQLGREIQRSKAVSNLAAQIVQNARLALDGARAIKANEVDGDTLMLGRGE